MEWIPAAAGRLACLLMLFALLAAGCAHQGPDAAAGPQSGSITGAHDDGHGRSRPVDPAANSPAQPPTVGSGAEPLEASAPTGDSELPLARGPLCGDADFNPLRADSPPLTLAATPTASPNPLRSAHAFSTVPRSAPKRASPATPRMSEAPGESIDSSPPAAADPPAVDPPTADPPIAVLAPSAAAEAHITHAKPPLAAAAAPPRDVAPPIDAAPPPEIAPPAITAIEPPLDFGPRNAAPAAGGGLPTRQPLMAGASVAPAPAPPAAVDADSAAYDVIQVFYGTDRAAAVAPANSLPEQAVQFLPMAISVLLTLALGLVAVAKRRSAAWLLVAGGGVVSLALGYQAASGSLAAVRRSGHAGPQYTSQRSPSGQTQLGRCEVTIPKSHQIGELEAPSILRLEIKPDAEKHVVLRRTERLADEQFYALLRERVAASPHKELFLFVHGFNVTFEDAARRTAQIHHDLRFAGAPVFYSWPAHDKFVLTYKADEANVSWSAAHLKQFLLDVVQHSQAESISLIAHSMGNRALAGVLKELQLELQDQSRLFNQVILAAPDIDADEFRHSIAPALARTANRVTLYASARDEALAASQLVHRGPRAGDAGRGLVVVPGIDTIDVTPIDTSPWGHTYYGSSDPVLRDLGLLLTQSAPPSERLWLAPAELEGQPYWVFQPQTATARLPTGQPR